jgi:hypothetical protein
MAANSTRATSARAVPYNLGTIGAGRLSRNLWSIQYPANFVKVRQETRIAEA